MSFDNRHIGSTKRRKQKRSTIKIKKASITEFEPGKRYFECYFCDCRHESKAFIVRHESWHNKKLFYQPATKYGCDICLTVCNSKGSLKTHTLVHLGEKPFACVECEYRSNQKSNLTTHITKHHRGGILLVQCQVVIFDILTISYLLYRLRHVNSPILFPFSHFVPISLFSCGHATL